MFNITLQEEPEMHYLVRTLVVASSLILPISSAFADVLPLTRGKYVLEGVQCESADNASSMYYAGNSLNTAHTIGTILSASKTQSSYHVVIKEKGDGGMGGNESSTFTRNIQILSENRMIVSTQYMPKGETFRLCR